MTERPILFSAPMVRAILAGKKTVTRRICKPANDKLSGTAASVERAAKSGWIAWWPSPVTAKETAERYDDGFRCPYGEPGDRLWVKETWAPSFKAPACQVAYKADGRCYGVGGDGEGGYMRVFHGWLIDSVARGDALGDTLGRSLYQPWKSPLFMPRWASRITLEVTDVRVERLQDITEEEVTAEGIADWKGPEHTFNPLVRFRELWDELNGKTHPWASNPWLWRVAFQVLSPSVARSEGWAA